MREKTRSMALSGLLAALALVIQCLGGLIPVATYVCPMLCCLLQSVVLFYCGKRIAWTWYCAVGLLSLLLGPDKEAAMVFVLLGYYPMIKPILEKSTLAIVWKLLLFNGVVVLLYGLLLKFLGLDAVVSESEEFGVFGLIILLILGNTVFFLLDRLLTILGKKRRRI